MGAHHLFKYSVTIKTSDYPLVTALRGLAYNAERHATPQISTGGTKRENWRDAADRVTFRFTAPSYRESFLRDARRLLPVDLWSESARSDDDPATPQR